jgi:hypothetical protein
MTFTSPLSGRAQQKDTIKQKIGQNWGNMFSAFSSVDQAKTGLVSKNEFKMVCQQANSNLTHDEASRMANYVGKRSPNVDYMKLAKDLNLNEQKKDFIATQAARILDLVSKEKSDLTGNHGDLTLKNL